MKLQQLNDSEGRPQDVWAFWCPGCRCGHFVDTRWTRSGTADAPTLTGSVLVRHIKLPETDPVTDDFARGPDGEHLLDEKGRILGSKDIVCHSFVTDGMIRYLADSTHELAGQTVPMVDFDDPFKDEVVDPRD